MPGLNQKYFHDKGFDQKKLDVGIAAFMVNEPSAQNHTSDSAANLAKIVNRLAVDARVTDIRWMAYMLATVTPGHANCRPFNLS
jgi:hypothetical protein